MAEEEKTSRTYKSPGAEHPEGGEDAAGVSSEELAGIRARREKILIHIDTQGQGLEIGPSHNPVAPKKDGFNVHIIDHLSREQLIEKYTGHGVRLENIEEVDFIWSGEPYAELTGKSRFYDWIIASHIIEHTTDLVGFLNDCDSIMKEDGVISLAVPDKRYCFDHFRPLTGLSKVMDAHYSGNTIHSPGTVAEFYLNVVSRGGQIGWDHLNEGEYRFVHSLDDAVEGIGKVVDDGEYIDVHSWCFTPHSLRLMIHDLNLLGLIPFREVSFFPTGGNEFFMTLGRDGAGPGVSRMDMLKAIESEEGQAAAAQELKRLRSSRSWKVTRPLREIRPLAERLKGLADNLRKRSSS